MDESHFEQVKRCLPEGKEVYLLPLRSGLPCIATFSFFIELLCSIFKYGLNYNSLILALLNTLSPRVVITIVDNSYFSSTLSTFYKKGKVFIIQNGVRHNHPSAIEGWQRSGHLPTLFSFGEYESDLLKEVNIESEEVIPVGSLKGSAFLHVNNLKLPLNSEGAKYDLCLISQFRKGLIESEGDPILEDYLKVNEDLVRVIDQVCLKENLRLCVAMSYNESHEYYQKEWEYIKGLLNKERIGKVSFISNDLNDLSSYHLAKSAKVVVAFDSTLSFEMFGMGKKVLFGGAMNTRFKNSFGLDFTFKKIPDVNKIKSNDIKDAAQQVRELLSMNNEDYLLKIEASPKYFMNYSDKETAEIIKEVILNELD